MQPNWGPVVLGFAMILLSLHPVAVEVLSWAIPAGPRNDRLLIAGGILALGGLAFIAFGAFGGRFARRRKEDRGPEPPTTAAQTPGKNQ